MRTHLCYLKYNKTTVNSFMATAATGPAWPLSWRTNKQRDKSHIIAVPSRDPDTMTLYAGLDDKHVTASVCPYRHCFIESCRLEYSQTVTTCAVVNIDQDCLTDVLFMCSHSVVDKILTELVPAVTISLEDGQTHATISPLLCIIASQTKIAFSLS